MPTDVTTYLLTQGVLGVAVIILGIVTVVDKPVTSLSPTTEFAVKLLVICAYPSVNVAKSIYYDYSIQSGIVSGISSASKLT